MRALLLAAFCLAFAAASFADKVVLKDGRSYEGVVLDENETSVKIKTAKATLTFQRDQVASVERVAGGALQEREKRLAALDPARPAEYLALADWLTGKGRDAYDLFWYLSDPDWPAPNLRLLNSALARMGWQGRPLTAASWRAAARKVLRDVRWPALRADVEPFLHPDANPALFTRDNLLALLRSRRTAERRG
jgi:hypothetical protein